MTHLTGLKQTYTLVNTSNIFEIKEQKDLQGVQISRLFPDLMRLAPGHIFNNILVWIRYDVLYRVGSGYNILGQVGVCLNNSFKLY